MLDPLVAALRQVRTGHRVADLRRDDRTNRIALRDRENNSVQGTRDTPGGSREAVSTACRSTSQMAGSTPAGDLVHQRPGPS